MTAIVIIAFAAHIAAWIVLPASKGMSKKVAVADVVSHAAHAIQMSGV
ncbi:MAG TPA: hypothetical protein VIJ28_08765 [Chloroflexota bacterium]|jgi:hypothetical protein